MAYEVFRDGAWYLRAAATGTVIPCPFGSQESAWAAADAASALPEAQRRLVDAGVAPLPGATWMVGGGDAPRPMEAL